MRMFCLIAIAGVVALAPATDAHADCLWTVSGRIRVQDHEIQATNIYRDLSGIEVKVSGATVNFPTGPAFSSWGSVYTDDMGNFTLLASKTCADRFFRVEVRLENSDLRVINGSGSDWYRVYQSGSRLPASTVNIGTRNFVDGTSSSDLSTPGNYMRAVQWYVVKSAMDAMIDADPWFGFSTQIHVKYPSVTLSGDSYANGIEWTAHIVSSQGDPLTVLHEVMHLWNFNHNSGTTNWADAIWGDWTTHGYQEEPNVAFHEGFAEFAAQALMNMLWGTGTSPAVTRAWVDGYLDPDEPAGPGNTGLDTPDMVQRNDIAVTRTLFLLTSPNLWPPGGLLITCPSEPNLTVFDVLHVFQADPSEGWGTDWQVGTASYGLLLFLDRADDILPAFDGTDHDLISETIDASSTLTPFMYCR
jgi:hypothetical protein